MKVGYPTEFLRRSAPWSPPRSADNDTDTDYWANGRGSYPADGFTPLSFQVAWKFGAGGGTISVRCISPVQAQVESVHLSALKVGQIQ